MDDAVRIVRHDLNIHFYDCTISVHRHRPGIPKIWGRAFCNLQMFGQKLADFHPDILSGVRMVLSVDSCRGIQLVTPQRDKTRKKACENGVDRVSTDEFFWPETHIPTGRKRLLRFDREFRLVQKKPSCIRRIIVIDATKPGKVG